MLGPSSTGGMQMIHHKLEQLDPDPARQLFRSYQRTQPLVAHTAELQELEDDIVKACDGLPLALEITGGLLGNVSEPGLWRVGGLRRRGASRACAVSVAGVNIAGRLYHAMLQRYAGRGFEASLPCYSAACHMPCRQAH